MVPSSRHVGPPHRVCGSYSVDLKVVSQDRFWPHSKADLNSTRNGEKYSTVFEKFVRELTVSAVETPLDHGMHPLLSVTGQLCCGVKVV